MPSTTSWRARWRALRDEGVLIVGSGNIVHNLRDAMSRMHTGASDTPDWAQRFDADMSQALLQHDAAALVAAWPGELGRRANPVARSLHSAACMRRPRATNVIA